MKNAIIILLMTISLMHAQTVIITGSVTNKNNIPIPDAIVLLKGQGLRDTTAANGNYFLFNGTEIKQSGSSPLKQGPSLKGTILTLSTVFPDQKITVWIYNSLGKVITRHDVKMPAPGTHSVNIFNTVLSAKGIYVVKVKAGEETYHFKTGLFGKVPDCIPVNKTNVNSFQKRTLPCAGRGTVDTIEVSATGYNTENIPVDTMICVVHIQLISNIKDTIPPVVTILGPNPINLGPGYKYIEYGAMAYDNVDGDITNKIDTSGEVNTSVGGTYIITYTVLDSAENLGKAERIVNVAKDITPPVITLLGDNPMQVLLNNPYIEPGATAFDGVDGDITDKIIIDNDSLDTSAIGTYPVLYTVSDTGGNTAQATRTVYVVASLDTVPPVITLLGPNPLLIAVGDPFVEPGYTAIDNVDGDITASVDVKGFVDTSTVGTYTLEYNVMDAVGNQAVQKTRSVNVVTPVDTVKPVITLKGSDTITITVGETYIEPGYTAIDDKDGDITSKVTTTNNIDNTTPGNYWVKYNVSDNAGNAAEEKTRNVIVNAITKLLREDFKTGENK